MRQTIRDLCECSSSLQTSNQGLLNQTLEPGLINFTPDWSKGVVIYLNRHGGTSRVTLNLQLKRSCQGSCYQHKNRINTCKSFDPCRPAFLWANLFPFARFVKVKYISIWIWWSNNTAFECTMYFDHLGIHLLTFSLTVFLNKASSFVLSSRGHERKNIPLISFWAYNLGVCSQEDLADSTNAIFLNSFKFSQFMRVISSTKPSHMIGLTKKWL